MVSLNQIRLRDRRGRPTFSGVYLDTPFATAKTSEVAWAEGWSKRSRIECFHHRPTRQVLGFVVRQSDPVQGSKAIMPPQHDQTAATRTLGAVVFRMAEAAFMQVSFILLACAVLGKLTEKGLSPFLAASALAFSFSGSITLGRSLRAEFESAYDEAGNLYSLTLVNYVTSYASFLLLGLTSLPVDS
jgi:hypothetical protein